MSNSILVKKFLFSILDHTIISHPFLKDKIIKLKYTTIDDNYSEIVIKAIRFYIFFSNFFLCIVPVNTI